MPSVQDQVMLFGDSITQGGFVDGGFGTRLADNYSRKLDVINRGYAGYNSDWALSIFEQVFPTVEDRKTLPTVKLLTIWFGANDACIEPSPQHVSLPKYASNLKHIINLVQSPKSPYYSPETRIVLITPPPVNTHQRVIELQARDPPMENDRRFDVTKSYADTVKDVAAEEEVAVVDVWTALMNAAGGEETKLSEFLYDGLHLTSAGYQVVYKTLMDTISTHVSHLHPDKLEYVHAPWTEIDYKNPAESLKRRNVSY